MTFIVGGVTGREAFQASDRLVTLDGREYDPTSNKVVIFRTREGLLSVAYAGVAYLGGLPTDRWIAETGWGHAFGDGIMNARGWPTLWEVAQRLLNGLTSTFSSVTLRSHVHQLLLTGLWVDKRQRLHSVLWRIEHKPGRSPECRLTRFDTRHLSSASLCAAWIGQSDARAIEELREGIASTVVAATGDALPLLVRTVRKTATLVPATVGGDIMSVRLFGEREIANVEVVYHAGKVQSVLYKDGHVRPPAYAPWFIAPGFASSPSLVSGDDPSWKTPTAVLRVKIENGQPATSTVVSWSHEHRRGVKGH